MMLQGRTRTLVYNLREQFTLYNNITSKYLREGLRQKTFGNDYRNQLLFLVRASSPKDLSVYKMCFKRSQILEHAFAPFHTSLPSPATEASQVCDVSSSRLVRTAP
jgi:hypothetical protein